MPTGEETSAGPSPESPELLADQARRLLERHWHDAGYTSPHPRVYPWRWLWDSCFHALTWLELGDERAVEELASVFRWQHPDGFVPHIGYQGDTPHHSFWGRSHASTITQPPMYGHVVSEMLGRGVDLPDEMVERARSGIEWILSTRRRPSGRVVIVHPWESGCDDSPHWDAWCPGPRWSRSAWYERKGDLVRSLELDRHGAAVSNPDFEVDSPGFNALVAFNADCLGIDHDIPWDPPDPEGDWAVTLDDLLVGLAWPDVRLLELALDESRFGGAFGPAGVRRDHPEFDPDGYWRGASWPHLTYLLWVAACRQGHDGAAHWLAERGVRGALASGWAEHWNPDTGTGGGARPHSWATVVLAMAGRGRPGRGGPTGPAGPTCT